VSSFHDFVNKSSFGVDFNNSDLSGTSSSEGSFDFSDCESASSVDFWESSFNSEDCSSAFDSVDFSDSENLSSAFSCNSSSQNFFGDFDVVSSFSVN